MSLLKNVTYLTSVIRHCSYKPIKRPNVIAASEALEQRKPPARTETLSLTQHLNTRIKVKYNYYAPEVKFGKQ